MWNSSGSAITLSVPIRGSESSSPNRRHPPSSEPASEVRGILLNRTTGWTSRIYENTGGEGGAQRAEAALRNSFHPEENGGDEGAIRREETTGGDNGSDVATPGGETGGVENKKSFDEFNGQESTNTNTNTNNTPSTIGAEATNLPVAEPLISWKCGICGYHVLAMDQDGSPLPLSRSAYGELLPIRCPRCEMEHTSWEQAIPFDKHGDHVNIRSKLSNNYVTQCRTSADVPASGDAKKQYTPPLSSPSPSANHNEIPPILANIGRVTYRDGVPITNVLMKPRQRAEVRMAFYCGLCGRRMLRVDSDGELVAMDCNASGEVLPIRCPGCKEVHNNWIVKPFTVGRLAVAPSPDKAQDDKANQCTEMLPSW